MKHHNKVIDKLCGRHTMYRKLGGVTTLIERMATGEFMLCLKKWDDSLTDYILAVEEWWWRHRQGNIQCSP